MSYSHHANLYRVNDVTACVPSQPAEGVELYEQFFEKLGIDDAKSLVTQAYSRPSAESKLCLVVRSNFITLEAQNALLKILEEPPVSSQFIFIVPYDFSILPTLASRFNECTESALYSVQQTSEFTTFLTGSYQERLAAIDLSVKNKDIGWQRSIKSGLTAFLRHEGKELGNYRELEFVTRTLLTRGASNKMLLEHTALLLGVREQID